MTRVEHMMWCKARAMEYVNTGDYVNAVASMVSDLGKHPDTRAMVQIAVMLMLIVKDKESARKFVEGFN